MVCVGGICGVWEGRGAFLQRRCAAPGATGRGGCGVWFLAFLLLQLNKRLRLCWGLFGIWLCWGSFGTCFGSRTPSPARARLGSGVGTDCPRGGGIISFSFLSFSFLSFSFLSISFLWFSFPSVSFLSLSFLRCPCRREDIEGSGAGLSLSSLSPFFTVSRHRRERRRSLTFFTVSFLHCLSASTGAAPVSRFLHCLSSLSFHNFPGAGGSRR